jgi:ABC-2 type transport system permease protein
MMFFGGVLLAASLSSLWPLRDIDLATLQLPAAQLAALQEQLAALAGSPALAALPLLERLIALAAQLAFSLLVLQAFRRRSPLYVVLAIVYHALVDFLAVFISTRVDNPWLIEGALFAAALPLIGWAMYLWRRERGQGASRRPNSRLELALFGESLRKELWQQWRTKRALVAGTVIVLFGLTSPLLARFTPEILGSIEGAEQFANLIPEPTVRDAYAQYIENLTQFGFIMVVLIGMGAVAGEKEKGTAAIILSKPLPRWAFVASKFLAQALVYLAALIVAGLGALLYTVVLFGPIDVGRFILMNGLLYLWLAVFVAITILGSAIGRSTGAAAGIGLGLAIFLLVGGSFPAIAPLAPAGLVGWAGQLGLAEPVPANGGALAGSLLLIILCLLGAIAVFERQEL